MLISYLQGLFHHGKAVAIAHVVIAGGLIASSSSSSPLSMIRHPNNAAAVTTSTTTNGCRELDGFCWQLTQATGIPVSILPGKDDPTTANWPQRPLHKSLLPRSSSSSLLSRSPNPYAATFSVTDGTTAAANTPTSTTRRYVLGTDGTNVADLRSKTMGGGATAAISELQALQNTLAYQHVCPTGPDSVPTAPHAETDPMVILAGAQQQQQPSVYFVGGCTRFATRLVTVQTAAATTTTGKATAATPAAVSPPPQLCRLVCVPKFIDTSTAVLVNLDTLAVELLRFEASS